MRFASPSFFVSSIAIGLLACSSAATTQRSFVDAAGHHCTVTDAPARASCDATPMPVQACPANESPCFFVGPLPNLQTMIIALDNCAMCCSADGTHADATGAFQSACASIPCKSDGDCPTGSCASGACVM